VISVEKYPQLSEFVIQRVLDKEFERKAKYIDFNTYVYRYNWETDFFMMLRSGYTTEIEIKISKADFKNDGNKKIKHQILKEGKFERPSYKGMINGTTEPVPWNRPNRFYYAVPENMITVDDVPDYAGLIYIVKRERYSKDPYDLSRSLNEYYDVRVIKEAPLLHKNKPDYSRILIEKFYYHYRKTQESYFRLLENKK
jgi:hypothetical protein